MKKIVMFMMILVLTFTGCGYAKKPKTADVTAEKNNKSEDKRKKEDENKKLDDGKDHDQGLLSMKLTDVDDLTEQQKKVVEYFDDDYLSMVFDSSYEFLLRYPDVVTDAQVLMCGIVTQVMSYENGHFEIVVQLTNYYGEVMGEDSIVVVQGIEGNMRYMKGDTIEFRGTYKGPQEYIDKDDISLQVPVVELASASDIYINKGMVMCNDKYDFSFIKDVAMAVFGDDIEVRMPTEDDYLGQDGEEIALDDFKAGIGPLYYNYYVCELDDQSNNKFSKYYLSAANGMIQDAARVGESYNEKPFQFTADFEHYIIINKNVDSDSNDMTHFFSIEYYDRTHKKIWERQFEDVGSYCYDYTETAMYMIINEDMYTINMDTGEDLKEPVYIGKKDYIRKLEDGIIAFDFDFETENDAYTTDAIMKLDLNGNIIWKQNVKGVVFDGELGFGGFQIIGKNILVDLWILDGERNDGMSVTERYMLIDNESGEVRQDVEPVM